MKNQTINVNVCFIANYFKTDLFLKVSQKLSLNNITVFWIVSNKKQFTKLKETHPENRLLYIGKKSILSFEGLELHHDFKINELVYGDRVLREESPKWTFKYLTNLKSVIYNFIKSNNITCIFGEVTWAHEILTFRLARERKELNCRFINPHTIRIPNGRFAFFTDEFQSIILEKKNHETQKAFSVKKIIKVEKPAYLDLNDKILKKKSSISYNIQLIKNFISRKNQDSNDPTLYGNPFNQFRIKTTEIINRIIFKNFVSEVKYEDIPNDKKKILFTLHKQPEASIDVIGRYYENQLDLITNVWRILPFNYILLIKEHSNAIGDRTYGFYNKIKNLKSTYLVDHKENSHKILPNVEAVFTVSGTIAYEAALKETFAFTFAPTFFNKLNHCQEVSWKMFRSHSSFEKLCDPNIKSNVEEFSSWMLENSYEGIISDSFGDPRCMEIGNINNICKALLTIINS